MADTMRCEKCLNSRPVISENGIVYICCLSSRAAVNCLSDKKDGFVKNPMRKEADGHDA